MLCCRHRSPVDNPALPDPLFQNGSRGLLAGQVFERFGFVQPLAVCGTQAVADAEDQTTTGSDGIRNVDLLIRLTSQCFFPPSSATQSVRALSVLRKGKDHHLHTKAVLLNHRASARGA